MFKMFVYGMDMIDGLPRVTIALAGRGLGIFIFCGKKRKKKLLIAVIANYT